MNASQVLETSNDKQPGASRPIQNVAAILSIAVALAWFALPRLIQIDRPLTVGSEQYNPRLNWINSLDNADRALPAFVKNSGQPQKDIADGIQAMLEQRFAHGFSRFHLRDNWIAYTLGRVFERISGSDNGTSSLPVIDAPVLPDDILKYRRAMCSQQMMVFEALLARHKIDYARVSFMKAPSHDAVAARVDGVWRFYDSDMEPKISGVPLATVRQGDILPAMYPVTQDGINLGAHFRDLARSGDIRVRDVNRYPASRGAFFQLATGVLSRWGWVLPLLLAVLLFRSGKRDRVPDQPPVL